MSNRGAEEENESNMLRERMEGMPGCLAYGYVGVCGDMMCGRNRKCSLSKSEEDGEQHFACVFSWGIKTCRCQSIQQ